MGITRRPIPSVLVLQLTAENFYITLIEQAVGIKPDRLFL